MATLPAPGDFGVQSTNGWAGWLIRLGTFSRYNHAAVVLEVRHPAGLGPLVQVVEAAPHGARKRLAVPDEFVWSTDATAGLTATQREQVVARAQACLGLPYDWWDIARFVPRFWGGKARGWTPDYADRRLICSELVVWCYRRAGVDLAPGRAPGAVSPGDLADWITRH